MHVQLALLFLGLSFNAFAVDDKAIQELFRSYEQVMDEKKVELIENVFSAKFIKNSGGKDELIQKIKDLKAPPDKLKSTISWKLGKGNLILAKMIPKIEQKSKQETQTTEFIVVIEDSKPKIDGTLSDAD